MRREEINEWFDLHRQSFGRSELMDKLRELALLGLEAEAKIAPPEAGGTSFTTVEFCGKPAAAPCAIEEQCQYGKDRDMVIEECAKVCESRAGSQAMAAFRILTSAADAIRGLKSREPQPQSNQEKP